MNDAPDHDDIMFAGSMVVLCAVACGIAGGLAIEAIWGQSVWVGMSFPVAAGVSTAAGVTVGTTATVGLYVACYVAGRVGYFLAGRAVAWDAYLRGDGGDRR